MRKYTFEEVRDFIASKDHTLLSTEYINNKQHLSIQCNRCGRIFPMRYDSFKNQGHRCECYSKPIVLTYEFVKKYIEEKGYHLLSNEYINNSIKLLVWCGNPDHEPFKVKFNNFKDNDSRCPYCHNNSKLENDTEEVLKKNNILFEMQYRFDDCKCKNPLPFDFYLPHNNICIECNGRQHYKYGCFENDLLNLMNIQYRDNIKIQYCKDNNIKLVIIPYWDKNNIENILIKELNL